MPEDNPRARLTKELLAEREKALLKQKEEYENKIKAMKEKTKLKNKSYKKEKILSPLQLLKEQEKNRKEISEFKNRQFAQSRTARFGRYFASGVNARKQMMQYSRSIKPSQKQNLRALRLQLAIAKLQSQKTRQQNFVRNNVGWDAHFVTPALEKEVSGFNGVSWEGSAIANRIAREVSGFGNILGNSFSAAGVSNEASFHAKNVNINPAMQLESEVSAFANVLNPYFNRKIKK